MRKQRIGILGGSFDPPQMGHLILAEYSRESLRMDHILFVPVADHPVKKGEIRLPFAHRLAMLELAIEDNPRFSISRVDVDRDGPHYSADTVKLIRAEYPQADLYFVMGGDNLRSLPTWERAQQLYQCCRLAVMKRADENISADMHDEVLPDLSNHVDIVDVPMLSIWLSSTYVVRRIRQNLSVRYLVPDKVLAYIAANNLYR
ncbi:MAG: nicotinate-nucleotide adenylyltransferase [Chloroflexi bacterium]|nr:nicotinate-nucleotide adenylyltransferase [Chloroflexota bacterium]